MKIKKYMAYAAFAFAFAVFSTAFPPLSTLAETPVSATSGVPVTVVGESEFVTKWLALAPFPNPKPEKPEAGSRGGGFGHDFLAQLGGESAARVTAEITLSGEFGGVAWSASAKPYTLDATRDLRTLFEPNEDVLGYLFADLQSERGGEMVFRFVQGAADYIKVWLNGELLPTQGAGEVPVMLKAGLNRLTLKVERRPWGWNVVGVHLLAKERADHHERVRRFTDNDMLRVKTPWFNPRFARPGKFPAVEFENPELTALLLDMETLTVRWFDADLNEVTEAAKPGFYCGYLTAQSSPNSQPLTWRRVVPFMVFDDPDKWLWRWDFDNKELTAWRDGDFNQTTWEANRPLLRDIFYDGWFQTVKGDDAPLWMGQMTLDRDPADAWREAPYTHLQEYMARLRHKVLSRPAPRPLAPPTAEPTAPALREGTEAEAGLKPGTVEKIRAVLEGWRDKSGHGFIAVVARRGTIVLHEAYTGAKDADKTVPWLSCPPNQLTDGKMTLASRLPTASVTKLFAGVTLGLCIDQGLVSLDDPVAKYFPDFPTSGPLSALTVRRLMNHTNGLDGHRNWLGLGGMLNPFLDNPALWLLASDASGLSYLNYNGFGIDLGGKVVEDITGRSVFRVMRDGLFEPLGMDRPTIRDLGYGLECTAMDLARMAEMLRLGGAYDGKRYMRPETLALLMPEPVKRHAPGIHASGGAEFGIGITYMRSPSRPEWNTDAPTILGRSTFGHGSATGAILQVDCENELIVAMARYTQGPDYEAHKDKFLQAIADGLEKQ